MPMNALSDPLMNTISPSDQESKSTFHTLFDDSFFPLSSGIPAVAVVIPLPSTTCRREVEWILFGLATLIGTSGELFNFFVLV